MIVRSWTGISVIAGGLTLFSGVEMARAQNGACCLPDAQCFELTQSFCEQSAGAFQGSGIPCVDTACGACCMADGSCVVTGVTDCQSGGGEHQGDGSACEAAPCPVPLGTAFTYQGQLKQAGVPVSATCDLVFILVDSPSDPMTILGSQMNPGVEITNGLFTVDLDFGSEPFGGDARWLVIWVCCPEPDDPPDHCASPPVNFTALNPPQKLAPAPYALYALASSSPWTASGSDIFYTDGNVGIGTTNPTRPLVVQGNANAEAVYSAGTLIAHKDYQESGPGLRISRTHSDFPSPSATTRTEIDGSQIDAYALVGGAPLNLNGDSPGDVYIARGGGNVRIGMTALGVAAKLDVNGAARTTTLEITGGSSVEHPLEGWGNNDDGQTEVPGGAFTAVTGGEKHSVAIRTDGALVGWGDNEYGQTDVPAGTFTVVAAGQSYGLALRTDGRVLAWGSNSAGQTEVPAGTFTAVAAGGGHGVA
ncbi:MAG: hypothetical protein ACYTFA_03730, partial [Planctomycetota bacterium]